MRRILNTGLVVASTAGLALVSACGGGGDKDKSGPSTPPSNPPSSAGKPAMEPNGIGKKAPKLIMAAAGKALATAKSVHLHGNVEGAKLNLFVGADASKGTITGPINGKKVKIQLLRAGGKTYIKSKPLAVQVAGPAKGKKIAGKWLTGPTVMSKAKNLLNFTDIKKLKPIISSAGAVKKGKKAKADGVPVITLVAGDGSRLYVATVGKPYPIKIAPKNEKSSGQALHFGDYDAPLDVQPPPPADIFKK